MGQCRNWSAEEIEYLENAWGRVKMPTIAQQLNRSINAIKIKAQRMGLGRFIHSGEYITLNQLFYAVKGRRVNGYDMVSYVENRGLPVKTKVIATARVRVIYIDEFWKWAEQNKYFLDFSKFEENMLGEEPEWVKLHRRLSFQKSLQYTKTPWTADEDERLKALLKQFKYTYLELSKILRRTSGAIQRRICDLGLKERPLKADNIPWTDEEKSLLRDMVAQGYDYEAMADVLNKSSKAIRGRVYSMFGSENLDKVACVLELK